MIIVGLDWSRCKHDFVIMNLQGEILERGTIAHNTSDLEELATRIEHRVDSTKQVRVGMELNDGALLAWLVTKGYTIFGIQPKSAQRARDIYRPIGSKDDRIDAFVIAEFVRINADRLRPWSKTYYKMIYSKYDSQELCIFVPDAMSGIAPSTGDAKSARAVSFSGVDRETGAAQERAAQRLERDFDRHVLRGAHCSLQSYGRIGPRCIVIASE